MKLKSLFFALFALISVAIQAQGTQREVVADSSWLTNKGGIFYQARATVYNTGEEVNTLTPMGDTSATVNKFSDFFRSETSRIAGDAITVSAYRSAITEFIRLGKTLPGVLGKSPLDSIRNENANLFNTNYWTVRSGTNSTGIRFRVTAQGEFQWRSDTATLAPGANPATLWKPGAYIGNVVRLNRYNGYTTDLYRKPGTNLWRTINGQYVLRPAAEGSARDLTDIEDPIPNEAPPLADTELRSDGLVRMGEKLFKYNTKKKLWEAK